MSQRTLTKIGTSTGVVIPKRFLQAAGARAGDKVSITPDTKNPKVWKVSLENTSSKNTEESARWAVDFVTKHLEAFKELAEK